MEAKLRVLSHRQMVYNGFVPFKRANRMIQGTFPNYNQLIPTEYSARGTLDVDEFKREARIAAEGIPTAPSCRS